MHLTPHRCPFCGSPHTSAFECDVGHWAVSCLACKAIGPEARSIAQAIDRWNAALAGNAEAAPQRPPGA